MRWYKFFWGKVLKLVNLPQQELGISLMLQAKSGLRSSGGHYITRQESGVLCGLIKLDL